MLAAQLATLSFVTPTHLGLPPAVTCAAAWPAALHALRRAAAYASPLDIMHSVAAACAHLEGLVASHEPAFVRLFSLLVLHARPPRLHSLLEYAARFVHADKLWDGRLGGALAISRAAVQWVCIQDPAALHAQGPH